MKTNYTIAKEKLTQYGLPALTNNELLEVLKFKGTVDDYYSSYQYKASKELVRRFEAPERKKIMSSQDAANVLSFLETEQDEQFWVIYMNRNSKILSTEFISKGSATGTVCNVQQIVRRALELKAQSAVLSHNHPSGNKQPSDADSRMTKSIKEALKLFEIQLLDHVIITNNGHFSFADDGLI